ncbi:MAG: metalloprotease, partial [Bacteriovoracaceae bacterium]|nr:metalloprotease [Bacteriovoracaceae bacterium]
DPHLLGSIVIDVDTANSQAVEFKHSLEREIYDLFIHGVLHLLGFDHQTKSEALQMSQYEKYFESLLDQIGKRKK